MVGTRAENGLLYVRTGVDASSDSTKHAKLHLLNLHAHHHPRSSCMQVYEKLLAQWRDLQAAKQGSIKHWLYR